MKISFEYYVLNTAMMIPNPKSDKELTKLIKLTTSYNKLYYDRIILKWTCEYDFLNEFLEILSLDSDIEIIIDKKSKQILKSLENKKILNDKAAIQDIGSTMKLEPFFYQKEAIYFGLKKQTALIVLPCGTGKTPIGVGLCTEAYKDKLIKGKCLIIVKASLKYQWLNEISKFSDLKAKIIESPSKMKKKFEEQFKDCNVYITNYEALKNETIYKRLMKENIELLYADEVHYINSYISNKSKAIYKFNKIKYKIGATATPITNNAINAFGIFNLLRPELFKSFNNFQKRFLVYLGFKKPWGSKNLDQLKEDIDEYMLIKTKKEVAKQLPKIMVNRIELEFPDEMIELNSKMFSEMEDLDRATKTMERGLTEDECKKNPKLLSLKNRQMELQIISQEFADDPELLLISESKRAKSYYCEAQSPKLIKCLELVEEIIESGEKVCIFSKFDKMLGILKREISNRFDVKIAVVNGSVDTKKRYEEIYTKFRDNNEYKVLIATNALAEGANLSKCKYLIEYELAESYAIQTQRHGRLERADSIHENVIIYQLVINGSWDDIQHKVISKKGHLHNAITSKI